MYGNATTLFEVYSVAEVASCAGKLIFLHKPIAVYILFGYLSFNHGKLAHVWQDPIRVGCRGKKL